MSEKLRKGEKKRPGKVRKREENRERQRIGRRGNKRKKDKKLMNRERLQYVLEHLSKINKKRKQSEPRMRNVRAKSRN